MKLHQYKDLAEYKKIQVEGNKQKIDTVWVAEKLFLVVVVGCLCSAYLIEHLGKKPSNLNPRQSEVHHSGPHSDTPPVKGVDCDHCGDKLDGEIYMVGVIDTEGLPNLYCPGCIEEVLPKNEE